jgi:hypothetical protein
MPFNVTRDVAPTFAMTANHCAAMLAINVTGIKGTVTLIPVP